MKLLLITLILISFEAQSYQLQCSSLFGLNSDFKKQSIPDRIMTPVEAAAAEKEQAATTEIADKKNRTLKSKKAKAFLKELEADLKKDGIELTETTKRKNEGRNIIMTMYYNFLQANSGRTVKIRATKTGYIDKNLEVSNENIQLDDINRNRTFLDFHMDEASDGSPAFKSRLLMPDEYVKLIGTSDFLGRYSEIYNSVVQIATHELRGLNTPLHEVKAVMETLKRLHLEEFILHPTLYTFFESREFTARLKYIDPKTNSPKYTDVKINEHRQINGKNLLHDFNLSIYDGYSVLEWRIPQFIADIKKKDAEDLIPGLKALNKFVKAVDEARSKHFSKNKSKYSTFKNADYDHDGYEFDKQILDEATTALIYKAAEKQINSTTGARGEAKITALTPVIRNLIQKFGEDLSKVGLNLILRDKQTEGKRNITLTTYFSLFRSHTGETIKLRARKYGTIDKTKSFTSSNIDFIDLTKNHSFMEFKMGIPGEVGAVYKPRMLMADTHIDMIGTPEFIKNYDTILKHTLQLNRTLETSDHETVTSMLVAIKALQANNYAIHPVLQTMYERFSYSAKFQYVSPTTGLTVSFDVQLTEDRTIDGYNLPHAIEYDTYRDGTSVFEWKIPLEVIRGGATLQALIPGYQIFLDFITAAENIHLEDQYDQGNGKMHHFKMTQPKPN